MSKIKIKNPYLSRHVIHIVLEMIDTWELIKTFKGRMASKKCMKKKTEKKCVYNYKSNVIDIIYLLSFKSIIIFPFHFLSFSFILLNKVFYFFTLSSLFVPTISVRYYKNKGQQQIKGKNKKI